MTNRLDVMTWGRREGARVFRLAVRRGEGDALCNSPQLLAVVGVARVPSLSERLAEWVFE